MSDYVAGKAWKQEKYDRILEAGYTLFSERGIDLVTMTEVANASGVGRMKAFRYFPSKTELVIAIYMELEGIYPLAQQSENTRRNCKAYWCRKAENVYRLVSGALPQSQGYAPVQLQL